VGDGVGFCVNLASFLFLAGRGNTAAQAAKKAAKVRKVKCVKGFEAKVVHTVAKGDMKVDGKGLVRFEGRSASTATRRKAVLKKVESSEVTLAEINALREAKKTKILKSGRQKAAHGGFVNELPDGRIRYYSAEDPAKITRPTDRMRGWRYVVEHDPRTGHVRSWKETLDLDGKIQIVHPNTINGMILDSVPHYPYTENDLKKFFGGIIE
jgi:hypothetical protein